MYTNGYLWRRVRKRVLVFGESRRHVAKTEHISRPTVRKMLCSESPPRSRRSPPRSRHRETPLPVPVRQPCSNKFQADKALQWLHSLTWFPPRFSEEFPQALAPLLEHLRLGLRQRQKAAAVLAKHRGISVHQIAKLIGVDRKSVRAWHSAFRSASTRQLFQRKKKRRKADDEALKTAIFRLLHEPPSLSGFNRTTWTLSALRQALAAKGNPICADIIRTVIKSAGYRWKKARVVLTSTDPLYREKLDYLQTVLKALKPSERFFSVDEFGPFAVKVKGGRTLVPPGMQPTVPQWQKSKGCLILTAALELSENQVTHFYSKAKNTAEMIRMSQALVAKYRSASKLYLSWDAASWHISKRLLKMVSEHNALAQSKSLPLLEVVPLPASAQFLNVIESVFSGMARAIIHNSDYSSVQAAQAAIDRYFRERNQHFKDNPKRAGSRIWGDEHTKTQFNIAANFKDPKYR